MTRYERFFKSEVSYLALANPEDPVLFFHPDRLEQQHEFFETHFPGLVTFAVKAQPSAEVIRILASQGMHAFDVASPAEMELVRRIVPFATLHYNNPIRSTEEIKSAIQFGVASYSIDRMAELDKLLSLLAEPAEISVRLKLSTKGGKIDFGSKFGADEDACIALLKRVEAAGHIPSMCFHPGTQCLDATAWVRYIAACSRISQKADVSLKRLNVGGGFPSRRTDEQIDLRQFFTQISSAVETAFSQAQPELLCEPGRAMVAEAFSLATRVKTTCENQVFLNDGIYGGLSEMRDIGTSTRISHHRNSETEFSQTKSSYTVFGPTCDSLDVLPDAIELPNNIKEGDFVIFEAMGAYSTAIATRFNGYGDIKLISLAK